MPYPYDKEHNTTLANAKPGEPLLVLRAQDKLAPGVVRHWAEVAERHGVNPEKVEDALRVAEAMEEWQKGNPSKLPD